MTNFDFLKNFNNELYEIGIKLEKDVISSPRAVTADATLFLENLVKDIYRLSEKKLEKNLISFYKKIDHLYRSGVITYIYKGKLQDAYNLRNRIHKKNLTSSEEKNLACDLHKRLFYISKKYYQDFSDNKRHVNISDYKKPENVEIYFENCIICGNSNKHSQSNMCRNCNQKIENANFMLSIQNNFRNTPFTRSDLVELGINESRAILLLMDLSKYGAVTNQGTYYLLDDENFKRYLDEIDEYIEIGIMLTRFYKDEISAHEIKETPQYGRGCDNQMPYREFAKLINHKIEKSFEDNLLKLKDIKKSQRMSAINDSNVRQWYYREKEAFNEGILNEAFILYNELLIDEFFRLKRKGQQDEYSILKQLKVTNDMYYFWQNQFMGGRFFRKNKSIKKEVIINEIKKNQTLNNALKTAKITRSEFDDMILLSKETNDEFYQSFESEYVQKRQKLLIKHLKNHNLNRAIKLSKITKSEFLKWYYDGEKVYSDFYIRVTELLMNKFLSYRKNDWDKKDILKRINVSRDMYQSWSNHCDLELFRDFEDKNNQITSTLIKRGLVINGIKEGKGKEEAIFAANITPKEFMEIYNNSKRENTDFHSRFDEEYEKNRKRLFSKLILKEDFYNTIQKCEISQKDFNRWYIKDQDRFITTGHSTSFYLTTTYELMDKYLEARINGKNQPDAAKSVGLSNIIVKKWLNHPEYDLFNSFKKKNKQVTIDLIVKGFTYNKTKIEVSDIYDIPIKTIDDFIEFGRNGIRKYGEVFELYENNVIPFHLEIFLKNFKTKSYYKSLKNVKLNENEIEYYYYAGKAGDERFIDFYEEFLDLKITIYVKAILSKKSHKIALKNSNLTRDELDELEEKIADIILKQRIYLIAERLYKNRRINGVRLAKIAGISVDELYEWYFNGKNGDVRFREFSMIFELGAILPRVLAIREAESIGIPKKYLNKRLKKDLGREDYRIWEKNDILNQEFEYLNSDGTGIDDKRVDEFIKSCEFFRNLDDESDLKKKIFHDGSIVKITVIDKNEVEGK